MAGSRKVRCQICDWSEMRYHGDGILTKTCPECGSRLTYDSPFPGDPPVTPDPKLKNTLNHPLALLQPLAGGH
jgi:hypothetical protein